MIRRGDVTDIAWVFAWLEMNCLITLSQEEELIVCLHYTQLGVFCKPQTIWISVALELGMFV